METKKEKTWKREVAVCLFAILIMFFIASFWFDRAFEIAEYLTTPIFMFGGGAFGLDSMSKQFGGK